MMLISAVGSMANCYRVTRVFLNLILILAVLFSSTSSQKLSREHGAFSGHTTRYFLKEVSVENKAGLKVDLNSRLPERTSNEV